MSKFDKLTDREVQEQEKTLRLTIGETEKWDELDAVRDELKRRGLRKLPRARVNVIPPLYD